MRKINKDFINNIKIQELESEFKNASVKGFCLLMICLNMELKKDKEGFLHCNMSVLCQYMGMSKKKLCKILRSLEAKNLIFLKKNEKKISLNIDKLLELLGFTFKRAIKNEVKKRKKTTKKRHVRNANERANAKKVKELYIAAYEKRYAMKPAMSVAENKLAYNLLTAVGIDEAVYLASAYLAYNEPYHLRSRHPFRLLVSDINAIRINLKAPEMVLESHMALKDIKEKAEIKYEEITEKAREADFLAIVEARKLREQGELIEDNRD